MIYQDPLAYLLGLEGVALLDAWAGDHDRAFTEARLAEIRRLLDDERLRDRGVLVEQVSAATVYEQVSAGDDAEAGGGLFATDEPVVAEYLACGEPGVALDAACGTGRFAEFLARRGHRVIGVDSSPDMPAHARRRCPEAEIDVAELDRTPLPDAPRRRSSCCRASALSTSPPRSGSLPSRLGTAPRRRPGHLLDVRTMQATTRRR